jgi:hypothetical protein
MTMDDIRTRFPQPVPCYPHLSSSAPSPSALSYCVGGAVVLAAGLSPSGRRGAFPAVYEVAQALAVLNGALAGNRLRRLKLANRIVWHNDAGEMDRAWTVVAEALAFTGQEDAPSTAGKKESTRLDSRLDRWE